MLTFNKNYFSLTIFILTIEILIALYIHDNFVRPYLGDVLVVILLYCLLKSFLKISVITAALIVLAFSFLVEFLQFLHLVDKLGLQKSTIARIVIGTSFSWVDMLMYAIGIGTVLIAEKY